VNDLLSGDKDQSGNAERDTDYLIMIDVFFIDRKAYHKQNDRYGYAVDKRRKADIPTYAVYHNHAEFQSDYTNTERYRRPCYVFDLAYKPVSMGSR